MSYRIIVDSCCELPEEYKKDDRFVIIPLGLQVGDYMIDDDENFNQKEFLEKVAACPECPKSSCPSPERYMSAYEEGIDHFYVVTLSSQLSGSYNSAVLSKDLYEEEHGKKDIYVVDSRSASCGETQIALRLMELEEEGLSFEEITQKIEEYVASMDTYFVLDNLETLRKNGRMSGVKAFVASTLSIKPVMGATEQGTIIQLGQAIGIRKALQKMVDEAIKKVKNPEQKRFIIAHCNCPDRAQSVKKMIESKQKFREILITDTAGISSMYANDGGIILTV